MGISILGEGRRGGEKSQTGQRPVQDGQDIWGFTGWLYLEVPEARST